MKNTLKLVISLAVLLAVVTVGSHLILHQTGSTPPDVSGDGQKPSISEPEVKPENPLTEIVSTIEWGENDLYAMVNLAENYEITTAEAYQNAQTQWGFSAGDAFENPYQVGGYEWHLMIPRYAEVEIQIYENLFVDAGEEKGELLWTHTGGAPFVLECNESDLFSNVIVEVACGDQSDKFSPMISLMDGALLIGERGQVLTTRK